MVAANANIGQAKAAFFPQLTLTGFYGYQSVALSDLFTSPARMWQFGPSVTFAIVHRRPVAREPQHRQGDISRRPLADLSADRAKRLPRSLGRP